MSKIVFKSNALNINKKFVAAYIDYLSEIVGKTFTPNGSYSVIETNGENRVTKDGYKTLMGVKEYSAREAFILNTLKSTLSKSGFAAGDGTTTTIYLANFLFRRLHKFYEENYLNEGKTYPDFKKDIAVVKETLLNKISTLSKKIESVEDILNLLDVSINGDVTLMKVFKDMIDELISSGTSIENLNITFRDDNALDHVTYEISDGVTIGKGLLFSDKATSVTGTLPSFYIESNLENYEIYPIFGELMKVLIQKYPDGLLIITEGYSRSVQDHIMKFLNDFAQQFKRIPKLYFADAERNYSKMGECRKADMIAKLKYTPVDLYTYYATEFKDNKATMTKEEYIMKMQNVLTDILEFMGEPTVVTMQAKTYNTKLTYVSGGNNDTGLENRINWYETVLDPSNTDLTESDRRLYKMMYGKLKGKVGTIRIGSMSMEDRARMVDACEDATLALKFALEDGIVPGMSLAIPKMVNNTESSKLEKCIAEAFLDITSVILEKANTNEEQRNEILSTLIGTQDFKAFDVKKKDFSNYIVSSSKAESSIFRNVLEFVVTLIGTEQILLDTDDAVEAYTFNELQKEEEARGDFDLPELPTRI